MLEGDGTLHVRRSVVDDFGEGHESFMNCVGGIDVLVSAGHHELLHGFGDDLAISDQESIGRPRRVDEVLVVACKDRLSGASLLDDGNLDIPPGHVSNTVFQGEDVRFGDNVQDGLKVERSFGSLGVLEADEGKLRGVPDVLVSCLRGTLLVTESQPAVRWVDQTCSGSSIFGSLGLNTGDVVSLGSDTGNNGDLALGRFDKRLDQFHLFIR